jgi:prevent-host-death family protein
MAKLKGSKPGMGIQDVPSHPRWQLQTAKSRFSEVFHRARAEGPQYVTRQGKEAVAIVRAKEFERLAGRTRQPQSLVAFFAQSPLADVELNLKRKTNYGRKVIL